MSLAPTLGLRTRPARRRAARRLAGVTGVLLAAAAFGAGALFGSLPPASDAATRVAAILRAHGGTYVRVPAAAPVARAIVAVEDRRFFEHGAVDPVAVARAALATLVHPGQDPGGSTIAQQLAKTLYVSRPDTLLGRLQAVGLAFKLEHDYSRTQILELYLNAIFYGHGYYGIGRAAAGYFGRAPAALGWAQAAVVAGLPQAPSAFDPVAHPALARARRAEVLRRLVATKLLPAGQATRMARAPLGVA